MDVTQYALILGGMFLLAVLLLGGGIAMYLGQRKNDAERIAEEKKAVLSQPRMEPAPPEKAAHTREDVVPPAAGGGVEILRVLRDPLDGHMSVNVLGKTAGSAREMDAARREQLRLTLEELGGWLDQADARGSAAEAGETAPEQTEATTGYFADTLPDRVELKDVLPFRKRNIPKLKEAPPPPRSIVAQIDEILQELLPGSPLHGQTIRLTEDLGGGLVIHTGERSYQGIEDVDDAEVKALIKRAVREWNEKNRLKPGSSSH